MSVRQIYNAVLKGGHNDWPDMQVCIRHIPVSRLLNKTKTKPRKITKNHTIWFGVRVTFERFLPHIPSSSGFLTSASPAACSKIKRSRLKVTRQCYIVIFCCVVHGSKQYVSIGSVIQINFL